MTKQQIQQKIKEAKEKLKTASGRNKVAIQKRITNLQNKLDNPTSPRNLTQSNRRKSRTGRSVNKTASEEKPLEITIKGGQKTGRQGDIGRTHMGDFVTKPKVAPKPNGKKTTTKRSKFGAMGGYMDFQDGNRKSYSFPKVLSRKV